jgi:hypothetical protein
MTSTPSGWQVVHEDRTVLRRVYSIGPGNTSNCIVAAFGDGELLVISGATGMEDAAFAELEAFGRVTALIAPNGMHRSGLPDWMRAFPEATVHAPAAALPRVRKVAPGAEELSPLEARLPEGLALREVPTLRFGETWMSLDTPRGPLWWVGDTITNMAALPTGLGWLFAVAGIRAGFSVNGAQTRFMSRDRATYRRWLREQVAERGPTGILPAHGDLVYDPGLPGTLRALVASI